MIRVGTSRQWANALRTNVVSLSAAAPSNNRIIGRSRPHKSRGFGNATRESIGRDSAGFTDWQSPGPEEHHCDEQHRRKVASFFCAKIDKRGDGPATIRSRTIDGRLNAILWDGSGEKRSSFRTEKAHPVPCQLTVDNVPGPRSATRTVTRTHAFFGGHEVRREVFDRLWLFSAGTLFHVGRLTSQALSS